MTCVHVCYLSIFRISSQWNPLRICKRFVRYLLPPRESLYWLVQAYLPVQVSHFLTPAIGRSFNTSILAGLSTYRGPGGLWTKQVSLFYGYVCYHAITPLSFRIHDSSLQSMRSTEIQALFGGSFTTDEICAQSLLPVARAFSHIATPF